MKTTTAFLVLLGILAASASAHAEAPVNKSYFGDLAVEGYDVISYFTDGKAVKGDKKFSVEHEGAMYRFSSEAHKAMFEKEPAKYLPAYGGFCAWAVAQGSTAGIDPEKWTMHEGRLYLNYNGRIQADWLKDKSGNIEKADANWPRIAAEKSK